MYLRNRRALKKGRSYMNQLFTVRQLSEKVIINEEQEDGGGMC